MKTVTQAIPDFAMSVFLLPIEMCREIERIMCRLWWKSSTKKDKNILWISWDMMYKSKMYGEMSFRHLRDFNVALLGKQGWRLITNPQSLVARMFKARYYPQDNFLNAKLEASPSFVRRSVLEAQQILKHGVACRVGNGNNIGIMNEP